jgi:hypothetical protein
MYIHALPSGAIACRLYATDVVVYYPDGRIHLDTSYASRSTALFADALTPYAVRTSNTRDNPHVYVVGVGEFVCPPEGLWLRHTMSEALAYNTQVACVPEDNPSLSQQCEKRLNLSRAAKARKPIAPLLAYAKTLAACGPMPHEAWRAMRGDWRGHRHDLQYLTPEDVANPENWPSLVSLCCSSDWTGVVRVNLADLKATLTTTMYRLYDVYDYVQLEWGTLPTDIKRYRRLESV